jgi:hypothetical protein
VLKKTIQFNGFDGEVSEEVWYFNLTEAEVTRLDAEFAPGLGEYVSNFDENTTSQEMLQLFERLIQMSVGIKSPDGTRFVKNQEVIDDFLASAAYSALFAQLATSPDMASEFFNGVLTKTFIEPKPIG